MAPSRADPAPKASFLNSRLDQDARANEAEGSMRPSRRWIWVVIVLIAGALTLPMPIAERYTSPTQDGQFLLHPLKSYRFVLAAARVSTSSKLSTSGKALEHAQTLFAGSDVRPTKVELLFFPEPQPYSYRTRADGPGRGQELRVDEPSRFVWEVWGTSPTDTGDGTEADVVALVDYVSGEVLASVR